MSPILTVIDTKARFNTMMDPKTAVWLAGRVAPHQERDAEQLAALRDASAGSSTRTQSPVERVQALFGRSQAPASANCDCTE